MADAYRGPVRLALCDVDGVLTDAHARVRRRATDVARACGGQGVAREVAEHLLQLCGLDLDDAYAPLLDEWNRHDAQQ